MRIPEAVMREPPPTGPSEPFPPAKEAVKSMAPPMMVGVIAIIAFLVAGVVLWSPWDSSDSNNIPAEERIVLPTPAQQGTPNP
jgi:hypothetical protein